MSPVVLLAAVCAANSSFTIPSIVPKPQLVQVNGGIYRLPATLAVQAPPEAAEAVALLSALVKPQKLVVKGTARPTITFAIDPATGQGDEGYVLDIDAQGVRIKSSGSAGLFYGAQTLRQLLPIELESHRPFELKDTPLPLVHIEDKPRFSWRGMHLDESRHFYGVEAVKRYIDLLALNKLNVFHWHLVDDGGWRIEIKKYPKLTEIGAWRRGTGKGWDYINIDFVPKPIVPEAQQAEAVYGGFYTQDQIREMVAYARQRFVTIVPEIEMPGHVLPAPFNYHEIGCDDVAVEAWKKATGMRYANVYCAGKEGTYTFVQNVLDEVCALFPSPFIHIGGDEVDKSLWHNCPTCQKKMQDEGLKNEQELQSYFVKRIEKYLNSKGKRLLGWDEILEGGLAPNATVMSWRGIEGGIEAAKSGHDVVMSPTSHCYFDYPYSSTSTELVYSFEPIPAALNDEEGKHVLGAQGNVWTEWMEDFGQVQRMAFPRAAALAEVVWSPKEGRRWIEFEGRLRGSYSRWAAMGVQFNLPTPIAKLDAIVFEKNATVEFEVPPFEGAVLRYTTDGTAPTGKSPVYTAPIAVDHTSDVRAALFLGNVGSLPIRVSCVKSAPATVPPGLTAGLTAQVKLGRFSKVADMSSITSSKTVSVVDFGIGIADTEDNFGIVFEGFVTIPSSGIYAFSTTSDDGSMLKIGGAVVVDNDGLHGSVEKTGRVYLPAGTYPFSVEFFEQGGAERLEVTVTPPNAAKGALPQSWLSHKS